MFLTIDSVGLAIPADGTHSQWVKIGLLRGVGTIILPSAWTAATLGFEGSMSEEDPATATAPGIWPIREAAGDIALTVTAGAALDFPAPRFAGWKWLRLRSGTVALPVAQASRREFTILAVPVVR